MNKRPRQKHMAAALKKDGLLNYVFSVFNSGAFWRGKLFTNLSIKEQAMFVKRLSFLIHGGVPILESLRLLRRSRSKNKTQIFDQIITDVERGQSLSTSMKKFRYIFGDFALSIVKVGESVGILDQNLNYLAEELKKKQELKRKVISALVYPCFIVAATLGIVVLLLTFVFPKVLPVFSTLKVQLPLPTRALIFLSGLVINYGFYIFAAVVLAVIIFWLLTKKSETIKTAIHSLLLRLPFLGKMIQDYQLANFFRTFGLLLKSGIAVSEAMQIVTDSTSNLVYKNEFKKLAQGLSKGKKISSYLDDNPRLFPEIAVQMISTGEHSGNLSETLLYLAEMYEGEVSELTKNLSGVIEPFLMIFMGVLVGFIAISIIMPIYQITQTLQR